MVTYNGAGSVRLGDIPSCEYPVFYEEVSSRLSDPSCHIGAYFAHPVDNELVFFFVLLDDAKGDVSVTSYRHGYYSEQELASLTAVHPQVHPFEREITELYGVRFADNPWGKPLRFPHNRVSANSCMDTYPFYSIEGDSLHEVNVGPIHAGIIEPGAFRFICNGERVLHLEIALGYQHRGVETLITSTQNRLRQNILCESAAGDTSVGHGLAYARIIEKLTASHGVSERLEAERAVALELERMAMHIADTGALCMDIGYQLGQVASEALRTIIINTTQLWCGNRFGKGLVRPLGTNFPLDRSLADVIIKNVEEVKRRYSEVYDDLKSTPSLLSRFEDCGIVSQAQLREIGAVGMAARAGGLKRDIRATHPWGVWDSHLKYEPEMCKQGDVMSRLGLRAAELLRSADIIIELLEALDMGSAVPSPDYSGKPEPSSFAFSLVEGWRGEICHCAVTGADGRLSAYKIKDPSVHNWMALALAVRGEGISDFPICNKSFNLSYCGHDL